MPCRLARFFTRMSLSHSGPPFLPTTGCTWKVLSSQTSYERFSAFDFLSGWWFQPLWKIFVKMGSSSPNFRGENKKYVRNHHPVIYLRIPHCNLQFKHVTTSPLMRCCNLAPHPDPRSWAFKSCQARQQDFFQNIYQTNNTQPACLLKKSWRDVAEDEKWLVFKLSLPKYHTMSVTSVALTTSSLH